MTRFFVYIDKQYINIDGPSLVFIAKEFKFTNYGTCEFFSDGKDIGYVDRYWIISKIVNSEPGNDDEVVWERND